MSSLRPVGGLGRLVPTEDARRKPTKTDTATEFADGLEGMLRPKPTATPPPAPPGAGNAGGPVQFSKHAQARMESRGIRLGEQDLSDLSGAIDQLAKRGAKESLVLMGDHAFIVGIPDRKVVTVLTRHEAAGNIFTQIDSTAVVR